MCHPIYNILHHLSHPLQVNLKDPSHVRKCVIDRNKYESPWEQESHGESIGCRYLNCEKVSKRLGRNQNVHDQAETERQAQD